MGQEQTLQLLKNKLEKIVVLVLPPSLAWHSTNSLGLLCAPQIMWHVARKKVKKRFGDVGYVTAMGEVHLYAFYNRGKAEAP